MRSSRPVPIILGALLTMFGLAVAAAGAALVLAHTTQRDADGFYTSPTYELATPSAVVATDDVDLGAHPGDWFPAPGDLTFRATVATPQDDAVFVGIAPQDELDAWLDGTAHATVERAGTAREGVVLDEHGGAGLARPPSSEDFWVATAEGAGTQTLSWEAEPGSWGLVIATPDGVGGLDATASAGVRTDLLLPIGAGLLAAGGLAAVVGIVLVLVGAAGTAAAVPVDDRARPAPTVTGQGRPSSAHPVTLEARLDPELSRGLWLVKWLLAIPHLVVLAVLWAVFVVLTLVAGIAILFTGRYPGSIFDLNVGILRWQWRVTYYAFGVLGTDRYPPFALAPDDAYPATFDVEPPEEMSRGLVLVKWWLLAIPHYLVLALLTGGITWTIDVGAPEGAEAVIGGGLIGVLALIAGGVLLVRGRYPTGLFDLLMGLQRWVYRVIAYVALMTDEYPPFRLDTGGTEPSSPAGPDVGPGAEGGVDREPARA
jgi:hypothetical protein